MSNIEELREKSVIDMLAWIKDDDMPAMARFFELVVARSGLAEFAEWAEMRQTGADMSHYWRNKEMSDVDRLSSLSGFSSVNDRVDFLKSNFADFMNLTKERYHSYPVTIPQLESTIKAGEKSSGYLEVLDSVIVRVLTNMGMTYRHFCYHCSGK